MNSPITLERELLFTAKEQPERQRAEGYAVGLFTGPRRKIAEAILELSEDDPTKPVEDGLLSAKCGSSLEALFKELSGCYLLPPAGFEAKVQALRLERKYSERAKLLEREIRNYKATGTWDTEAQALLGILDREIEELAKGPAEVDPARFLMSGSEVAALDVSIEYVVDQLVVDKAVTVVISRGGTGKSTFFMQSGQAVASGNPIFSLPTKRRPVVIIDYENPIAWVADRIRLIGANDISLWHYSFSTPPPKLDSDRWDVYKRLPAGSLLVFDTLRSSHSGTQNDDEIMSLVMGRLRELTSCGFTVQAAHHTPKSNERVSKGSSTIVDLADCALSLYPVKRSTFQKIEDDGEPDPDALYRLGTGEKSRFAPAQTFLQRTPEGLFTLAASPDQDRIDAIADHLRQAPGPLTQSALIEWIKEELEIGRRGKALALLLRGEGASWRSRLEGRRRLYEAIHD